MRRANGTGSVVKLSGSRRRPWAVRVSYRNERGRVRQRYLSYHAKAAEAQAALDEWFRTHGQIDLTPTDYTFGQVYDLWCSREYPRLGPASVSSHKASWGRVSVLKDRKMRKITLDELQAILDQDEQQGLSQSSINNDKSLISALFRYAMQRDIIVKDYSRYLQVPSVGAKMVKGVLTDLQLAKLEQLAGDGVPWADTVLMLCYTGFRVSEFLELTRFSYHAEGDYLQGGKKTAAGRNRIVPVHPKIKPYLLAWLAKGGDRIICKEDGTALRDNLYREKFRALMIQIGAVEPLPTPHWCRHTFASRLHQAGADELAVKRMLGHSDKDVTEHYTHIDVEFLRQQLLRAS